MLERLKVPIIMMGPYSYDAAPCELFFAAFKSADINPAKVPLGKQHFLEVVKLVVKRCLEIPKHHLLLSGPGRSPQIPCSCSRVGTVTSAVLLPSRLLLLRL